MRTSLPCASAHSGKCPGPLALALALLIPAPGLSHTFPPQSRLLGVLGVVARETHSCLRRSPELGVQNFGSWL